MLQRRLLSTLVILFSACTLSAESPMYISVGTPTPTPTPPPDCTIELVTKSFLNDSFKQHTKAEDIPPEFYEAAALADIDFLYSFYGGGVGEWIANPDEDYQSGCVQRPYGPKRKLLNAGSNQKLAFIHLVQGGLATVEFLHFTCKSDIGEFVIYQCGIDRQRENESVPASISLLRTRFQKHCEIKRAWYPFASWKGADRCRAFLKENCVSDSGEPIPIYLCAEKLRTKNGYPFKNTVCDKAKLLEGRLADFQK